MKGVAVLEGARYVFNKARIHEPDDGYVRMSDETSPILQPFKFYTYYAALHASMYMISDVMPRHLSVACHQTCSAFVLDCRWSVNVHDHVPHFSLPVIALAWEH